MVKENGTVRGGAVSALPALAWIIGTVITLSAGCGGEEFAQLPPVGDDAGDSSTDGHVGGSAGSKPDAEAGVSEAGDAEASAGDADAACGEGFKDCSGKCVANDDPKTGCAAKSCTACAVPNATATCSDTGACAIGECTDGFADCDNSPANGCEANLQSDPKNCNGCGTVCPATTGTPVCESGVCGVSDCALGKGDCDKDKSNGCEVDTTTTVDHCGFCGNKCDIPYATEKCVESVCQVDTCDDKRGNCNGEPGDGCEVDLSNTTDHCGECSKVCPAAEHATASCVDSACKLNCETTFKDCDGDALNGCEIDSSSDALHCSDCNKPCVVPNATPACSSSKCVVGSCNANFSDCNSLPGDGCEVNLQTDPLHCSACDHSCTVPPHAVATCAGGSCGFACEGTWYDCDGDPTNGCEVDRSADVNHCGACETVCATANGTPACVGGVCAVGTCNLGFLNCNGQADTDCEVDGQSSVANCGQCGHLCYLANAASACAAGTCVFTCAAPYADCDVGPVDSCNIDTNSSMDHCGGCGKKCDPANALTKSCNSGTCTIGQCQSGFANCNNQVSDGCEINIASDTANCGVCNNKCEYDNATPLCVNAQCSMGPCLGTWKNCDGQTGNGCEIDVASSLANCGGCGKVCAFANAPEYCNNGVCSMGACDSGFKDCDDDAATGCEAQLANDPKNCGACGHDCYGGTCTNGRCNPVAIATGLTNPWSIAVDSTHVYWSTAWVSPGGMIQRVPINGGIVQNIATGQGAPNGIAINSKNVYWANGVSKNVMMAPKDGSSDPVQIWSGAEAAAVSATESSIAFDTWTGGIYRANADGSGVAALIMALPNTNPNRIVTDGSYIWWANWGGDQVRRIPFGGGTMNEIASAQDGALNVAIDGTHVFWTAEGAKTVMRALKEGGSITTMASSQNGPIGLTVDATWLYFASSTDGVVRRMIKTGAPQAIETLATGQQGPSFMAVDATSLYWSNQSGGQIMRLRLP